MKFDIEAVKRFIDKSDRCLANEACEMTDCMYFSRPGDYAEVVAFVKNVLENDLHWINCDERLPEDGELVITLIYGHDVIVVDKGETLEQALERIGRYRRTSVGFYSHEDGGWCSSDGYPEICTPRYWMAIPNPPKDEEEAE